jgi:hypothetical protein
MESELTLVVEGAGLDALTAVKAAGIEVKQARVNGVPVDPDATPGGVAEVAAEPVPASAAPPASPPVTIRKAPAKKAAPKKAK